MKYKILVATFTAALGLQGALASDFDEQACAALKGTKIYDTKISEAIWNQSGEIGADKMSALTGGAKKTLKAAPHCNSRRDSLAHGLGRQALRHKI